MGETRLIVALRRDRRGMINDAAWCTSREVHSSGALKFESRVGKGSRKQKTPTPHKKKNRCPLKQPTRIGGQREESRGARRW